MKKFISLLLVTLMLTSFTINAMASENGNSDIPENATAHTIELTVNPDSTVEGTEDGISPFIWNQENHTVSGNKTYTMQFNVPERYFAYETSATDANGNAISGRYTVQLLYAPTFSTLASVTHTANGTTYKLDNIDLEASNERVLFCITNHAGVPLSVIITYYSWT